MYGPRRIRTSISRFALLPLPFCRLIRYYRPVLLSFWLRSSIPCTVSYSIFLLRQNIPLKSNFFNGRRFPTRFPFAERTVSILSNGYIVPFDSEISPAPFSFSLSIPIQTIHTYRKFLCISVFPLELPRVARSKGLLGVLI